MSIKILSFLAIFCCAQAAGAQEATAPISAIDWLSHNAPELQNTHIKAEPPIANAATSPSVSVSELSPDGRRRVGLIPQSLSGLAPDLWHDSPPATLHTLLRTARDQRLPIGQDLLLKVLLAEADDLDDPVGARDWLVARIDTLIYLGAVDPARALLAQVGGASGQDAFARWMELSLLAKSEEAPCLTLMERPQLTTDEALRIYCTARTGQFDTAALLFGSASAIKAIPSDMEALLGHFLDPELYQESALPRAPVRPNALVFRLFEAAGAPLPTAPLPKSFSHNDLSEDAGWKAQLEAAERLARAGVLSANQFLGIYTQRKPAASGGVWNRVATLQSFEAALNAGKAKRISAALPAAWRSMKSAGLQMLFSEVFAARLVGMNLSTDAQDIAFRMGLLAELNMRKPDLAASNPQNQLLCMIQGTPAPGLRATSTLAKSVIDGLSRPIVPRLDEPDGEDLLRILAQLAAAGRGNADALSEVLTDLRSFGLVGEAKRAALQAVILLDDA